MSSAPKKWLTLDKAGRAESIRLGGFSEHFISLCVDDDWYELPERVREIINGSGCLFKLAAPEPEGRKQP